MEAKSSAEISYAASWDSDSNAGREPDLTVDGEPDSTVDGEPDSAAGGEPDLPAETSTVPESEELAQFLKRAKPQTARAIFDILFVAYARIVLPYLLFLAFPGPLTFIVSFGFISSGMGILVALSHESQHGALLPDRKWNNRIGAWLCAYPVGSIWGASRLVHLAHHRNLNTNDDPDRHFHIEDDKSEPWQFVVHFLKMLLGGQFWTSIVVNGFLRRRSQAGLEKSDLARCQPQSQAKKKHPEILNLVPVQLAIFLFFFVTSGIWWTYFALWLAPIFTLGTLLGYVRGFIDHARLQKDDPLASKERLISVPRPSLIDRLTVTGLDFHFHGEHHLFPFVPHHLLPELHAILRRHPDYQDKILYRRSYWEFLCEYWREISASKGVVRRQI